MRLGVAAEQFDLEQPGVLGVGDTAPSGPGDLNGIDALDENVVARCQKICGDGISDEVARILNACGPISPELRSACSMVSTRR